MRERSRSERTAFIHVCIYGPPHSNGNRRKARRRFQCIDFTILDENKSVLQKKDGTVIICEGKLGTMSREQAR